MTNQMFNAGYEAAKVDGPRAPCLNPEYMAKVKADGFIAKDADDFSKGYQTRCDEEAQAVLDNWND